MDNYLYDIDTVIHSGMSVMVGGFGGHGVPSKLIDLLSRSQKAKDLTIISNDTGLQEDGLFLLLKRKKVKNLICSYVGQNKEVERLLMDVETTIIPQGVLAEKIRAGGAGIKAIVLELCGKEYYEKSIKADVALIKADSIDSYNNLVYRGTNRNFNPIMASAANKIIVEVDSFYRGAFNREYIITSSLYVDLIYEESRYKK